MAAPPAEVRRMQFHNQDGQKLVGLLTLSNSSPADAKNRCVILCHGYASFKDGFQLPAIAAALAGAGYNSLRFDFSGNGDSEGAFRLAGYWGEVGEVAAAKQHLEQQEGQQVVGLLGHSKGGDVVVLYASRHGDILAVINVAGRYDLREGVTMRFGEDVYTRVQQGPVPAVAQRDDGRSWAWQLTKEDLDDRLSTDVPAAAAAIQHCKVLTIHGTADTVIPVTDGRQLAAAIPGSRLVEVAGADHNFRTGDNHVQQLIDVVLTFLQEQQQEEEPAKV